MNEPESYSKPTIDIKRFRWLYILLAFILLFYLFQLFSYQVINGAAYRAQADENRTRIISDTTERGIIYDRNGIVLARNIPSYNVTVTPAQLPDPDDDPGEQYRIFSQLSPLIDIPISRGVLDEESARLFTPCASDLGIEQIVEIAATNWPFQPTRLKCNVSQEVAMAIKEKAMDWPGIDIEIESIREYPTGEITAEVVGFLGPIPEAELNYYQDQGFVSGRDKVGYAGIERSMQSELGGRNGERVVEVSVGGEIIRNLEEPKPPVPGSSIYLTLDARLQQISRDALLKSMDYWNTRFGYTLTSSGAVVAMNVKTGEILAMVNYPSYENNRMTRFIPSYYYEQLALDESKPLLNKAFQTRLPPGSTYKLVTALGALNEGVITPEQQLDCSGRITLMQTFSNNTPSFPLEYVCWERDGHGPVDYLHGIAWSCNIYWYKVGGGYDAELPGGGLGIIRMNEYARALGYGLYTNIELEGEDPGLVPDPTWKRRNQGENWATGDTYLAAVGQGYVLATPVQVLNSIATIANDGKHMQMTLIHHIIGPDGDVTKAFEPKMLWDITKDPLIGVFDENNQPVTYINEAGERVQEKKTVQPWIVALAKRGMEMVTVGDGTAHFEFEGDDNHVAGKTGTAEYCDNLAISQGWCDETFKTWPAHAWFVGYAPREDPEIAVVAFAYNGKEGSTLAAPIVRKIIDAYFEFKEADGIEDNTLPEPTGGSGLESFPSVSVPAVIVPVNPYAVRLP